MPVASKISRGRVGLHLPEDMRGDAFKIVTDEAWHAQFSYDLIHDVEQETGIPAHLLFLPAFVERLDAIRMRLPSELRGTEGLLFAVVSETLISNILADVPRDPWLSKAVRDLIRDHVEDEGRHHVYFRTLLRYFWPALSHDERRTIGPYLPQIILAFLEPDYAAIGRSLRLVGHSVAETKQILDETWPDGRAARDAADAARSVTKYLTEVGALDDPETADAFVSSGLLGAAPA